MSGHSVENAASIERRMRALLSEADSGGMGWRDRLDAAVSLLAQAWDEGATYAVDDWFDKMQPVTAFNPHRPTPPAEPEAPR